MNYLNIHTDILRSVEYLGAEPVQRATWLSLLGWCASQENGGRIIGASSWGDRKWQQLCGITKSESEAESDLFWMDNEDMVVHFYPSEKENEVKKLRELGKMSTEAKKSAAKANGKRGGRPPITQQETQQETQLKTHAKPIEGKGREGKGKEGVCVEPKNTPTHTDFLISRFNSCHPSYSSPALSAKELSAFVANSAYAVTIPDGDWPIIAEWMKARVDWKPKNRLQLIDNIDQCHTYALDWRRKNPIPKKTQKPDQDPSSGEKGMTQEEIAEWIKEGSKKIS